ncbi:MAG: thioredoxin family protein [Planctomycetota bacterium]
MSDRVRFMGVWPAGASVSAGLARLWACLLAVLCAAPALGLAGEVEREAHTDVRLISSHDTVAPGQTVLLGVEFAMDPGWHIYWTNPGEAGMPTRVQWSVVAIGEGEGGEAGVEVEALAPTQLGLPTPVRFVDPYGTVGFGYEGKAVFAAEFTVPGDWSGDSIGFTARATFLSCKEICIPGDVEVRLVLPVSRLDAPAVSTEAPWIADSIARRPRWIAEAQFRAYRGEAGVLVFEARGGGLPGLVSERYPPLVIPGQGGVVVPKAAQGFTVEAGDGNHDDVLRLELQPPPRKTPDRIAGLLLLRPDLAKSDEVLPAGAGSLSVPIDVVVDDAPGAWSAGPETEPAGIETVAGAGDTDDAATDAESANGAVLSAAAPGTDLPLGLAAVYAALAGMVLNIMPCVFPVLAIKVMGFVQQAGESRTKVLVHGLVFALGVLVSFWAMAAAVIGLAQAGQAVGGQGFLLAQPWFVAAMAVLMVAIGLNFLGAFDVGAGVMTAAGKASVKVEKGGLRGSFGAGLLTTALATPCAAPFVALNGAVSLAYSDSTVNTLVIFSAMGAGLALPVVLLSAFPGWLKALPRPGAWMEAFRQVMAFPMFVVALWLATIFVGLTSDAGFLRLTVGLVVAAMGLWAWGRFGGAGAPVGRRRVAGGLALAGVAGGMALAMSTPVDPLEEGISSAVDPAEVVFVVNDRLQWVPYSAETVRAFREAGRPVFIDFTADWCASCKAFEKAFIETEPVRQAVLEHNVALVKADWTRMEANVAVTEALYSFGVKSVPLYVFYPADPGAEPQVTQGFASAQQVVERLVWAAEQGDGGAPSVAAEKPAESARAPNPA